MNTDLEKAREIFSKDLFASKATDIVIEAVGEHYAKCSFEIGENHKNAYGGVMGGAIFTLADFTFAVSSNFNQPQTVSTASQIAFLGMAKGSKVIAESTLIKDGKTTCLYAVNVTDDAGTKIAYVTINGMKLQK